MTRIYSGISSNICWGRDKIASLNYKVSLARNLIISGISGIVTLENVLPFLAKIPQEFQKYAPFKSFADKALPVLKDYKTKLVTAKDFTSILVFVVTAAELSNPQFWTNSKNSFARKASKSCKLVYSGLETFFLVPDKWHLIDLGRWCQNVGSLTGLGTALSVTNIFIVKEFFVVGYAGFGIWYSTQEMGKAQVVIDKNSTRKSKLEKIQLLLLERDNSSSSQVSKLAREYLAGRNKRPALIKAYKEILKQPALRSKAEEKVRRIAYFSARFTEESLLEECQKSVVNNLIRKRLNGLLPDIGDDSIQLMLSTLLSEAPKSADLSQKLELMTPFLDVEDLVRIEPILAEAKEAFDILHKVTPHTRGNHFEAKFKKIIDYKIKKAKINLECQHSQKTKFELSRWFDIARIAFVALGLLVVTGLTLTYLAGLAAAIGVGSAISGTAIGVLGLARLIYDLFYQKSPKNLAYPSTHLA